MTEKQINFVTFLLKELAYEDNRFKKLYEQIPTNNEKYPDTKVDYRGTILADRLSPLTQEQTNKIIVALKSKTMGAKLAVRSLFLKYNIIN